MSNPTSSFGWQMPTASDLVTDLPADFEVFGQAVDTTLADLKGGTTGQILSKNSNTDMDFIWTSANPGDITGVSVTSPITGGGTSGDVTIGINDATTSVKGAVQLTDSTASTSTTTAATPNAVKSAYDLANAAIPKSTVTTSGDIIYATGSGAVTRRGIGSTGQVLTVSGGVPTWATPAGGGKVLQVVMGTYSTQVSSFSNTYIDTGLSASITPSSSSSKVLVLVTHNGNVSFTSSYLAMKLQRNGGDILRLSDTAQYAGSTDIRGSIGAVYLDSPATTSSTTYKTVFCSKSNSGTVRVQNSDYDGSTSTIILMEIGA